MDAILAGLNQLGQLNVLIALFAGAVSGVIIGAIPGLGPAVAIAVLLPATYTMEPLTALTLLLGIYSGAWYGGAIPAILINTPGTPVNVLTTYDGYPMTLAGQARRALSLAYSASFVGGIVSVIVLILLAQPLADIASNFGSAEFAMAALMAMVLVVVAHRGRVVTAAVTLAFGLFLATVGLETAFNTQRFTFGQVWLQGGVPLIPLVLGLFAMSQAFVLLLGEDQAGEPPRLTGRFFQGLTEVFRYPKTLFASSGFGVFMGILPGVGEFLAQFFSYTLAQKTSKTPELFGKGAPEGLIASEAANNAVPAAALVPLLALGIPGEALTAMMLSVFMVHNVIPGPELFASRPEFISGLYLSLLAMNVIILIFLLFATPMIVALTRINTRFIGVVILALTLVGTYTANYNITDPLMALVFGLIGFILKRHNIPIVPIVLGVVLGPIFEARLRQALGTAGGDMAIFVERPYSAGLVAIMAVTAIAITLNNHRRRQRERMAAGRG